MPTDHLVNMAAPGTGQPPEVTRNPQPSACIFPLLVAVSFAASRFRFWLPFCRLKSFRGTILSKYGLHVPGGLRDSVTLLFSHCIFNALRMARPSRGTGHGFTGLGFDPRSSTRRRAISQCWYASFYAATATYRPCDPKAAKAAHSSRFSILPVIHCSAQNRQRQFNKIRIEG